MPKNTKKITWKARLQRWRKDWRRLVGPVIAVVGVTSLLLIIGVTGVAVQARTDIDAPCPIELDKLNALPAGVVAWAKPEELRVNGSFCLAWKPDELFAVENTTRADRTLTRDLAEGDLKAASESLRTIPATATPLERTAAETRRRATQIRRDEAENLLNALHKDYPLAVFINDQATPITFRSPPQSKQPWVSKRVPLQAPEDANIAGAKVWRNILSDAASRDVRKIRVSLGDENGTLPREGTEIKDMTLRVLNPGWLLAGAAAYLAMALGVILTGWKTVMLRDRPVDPTIRNDNPTFSLGRVQIAWWLFLSLAGFLFIWLITAQWTNVFNMSVVALLGISGVSGAAAAAIDAQPPPQSLQPAPLLQAAPLGNAPAQVQPPPAPPPQPPPPPPQSQGLWLDLTSNGDGIVLHRLQMVAWTVVLGLIFVWTVGRSYSFPAFDSAMLVLAGLVNGVYVGFKVPERNL